MEPAAQQAVGYLLEKLLTTMNSLLMTPAEMIRLQSNGAPLEELPIELIVSGKIQVTAIVTHCDSSGCDVCFDSWVEIYDKNKNTYTGV